MRDYLIFSIAAPMASFGALAVGERRPSSNHPAKSGIIGFLAAALGIERGEEARLAALRDSLGFAVRVDDPGIPAFDYHTSQVPRKNRRFATRAEELSVPKTELKTILSTREYRMDAFISPAVWLRQPDAPHSLEEMAAALRAPAFTLFAGRKAHPLMLPCDAKIVQADTLPAAFAAFDAKEKDAIKHLKDELLTKTGRARSKPAPVIYTDLDGVTGTPTDRVEQRRDAPENRAKWRFGLRQEAVLRSHDGGNA
ncbi:MAG: type I-E CRISPR-associated protein Cas5/CasD [Hyphomicrobiales bacterium]|nr:type I-E CRISPR-associated protein Cas5/CasD [Hyphomicrobiales bacterium]